MIFPKIKFIVMFIGLSFLAGSARAEGEAVASPAKRQEMLDQGKKLLATRSIAPVKVDPFHSERFAEMVAGPRPAAVAAASPRTEKEILRAMAASLKPTGNFVVGGEPTLVFGQKRVKAGSSLTITFEGKEYTLEITAIERTSFTLRLNREEFTRPIK